jgi:hypothetical protein
MQYSFAQPAARIGGSSGGISAVGAVTCDEDSAYPLFHFGTTGTDSPPKLSRNKANKPPQKPGAATEPVGRGVFGAGNGGGGAKFVFGSSPSKNQASAGQSTIDTESSGPENVAPSPSRQVRKFRRARGDPGGSAFNGGSEKTGVLPFCSPTKQGLAPVAAEAASPLTSVSTSKAAETAAAAA